MGTLELVTCPATSVQNDEDPDAWPPDFNDDQRVSIQDITSFLAPVRRINTSPGDRDFDVRWDLVPGRGIFTKVINIQDLTTTFSPTHFDRCTIAPLPPYSHSWYITNPDANVMYQLGQSDGAFDNQRCTSSTVVLDFGQPDRLGDPASYDGYGTYYFATDAFGNLLYMSDSEIVAAAENYAAGWYGATGLCPRLKLVVGTNNYNQCPTAGVGCTPLGAGWYWAMVVLVVQSYLTESGYDSQITAWAGDDIEQPSPGYPWDCADRTRPFVDAFNANNASSARLLDYGTAWVPNPYPEGTCWNAEDVYHVAFGAVYDWPLPLIYTKPATDSWIGIRLQHAMYFLGVVAECPYPPYSDPLPTGWCWVDPYGWQNAPTQAWWQLLITLNLNGVGQTSLDYATNVRFQQ